MASDGAGRVDLTLAMTRGQLDIWCEKGILGLVTGILVFGPLATGAVRPLEFLIIQGFSLTALLLWLVRLWLVPDHRILFPPVCWAVLTFVAYAVIRYQQADIEYVARQELSRVLVYAILFFVILNNLAKQEASQFISYMLAFLAMAISIYAIFQFATNSPYVWHFIKPAGYMNRGSGTYICPNHLAGFLEMVLPLALAFTFTSRVNHLLRVFLGYAALIVLAGIAVSISRAGWVATGLVLLLFFLLLIKKRQYRVPALIALVVVVAAATVFYSKVQHARERVSRIMAEDDAFESSRLRLHLLPPATRMWLDHFWFGVGPAHFDCRFPAYRPPMVQARPGRVHNDYLNTLADWGAVGAVLVATAWGLVFWGVFTTWRFVRRDPSDLGGKPSNRAAFVSGAALGLLAILIHSLLDFNMHIPANAIVAVTLLALLSGYLRYATERHWVKAGLAVRVLVTLLGVACLGYLGRQGLHRVREYIWLDRAGRERLYLEAATSALRKGNQSNASDPVTAVAMAKATQRYISALEEATRVEPMNAETFHELGEALRQLSWQGQNGYEALATQAIEHFKRALSLDPYDPRNYMRIGMCLDWLGRHAEAVKYFDEAIRRDPNNYLVRAHAGWHYVQVEDYDKAENWFRKSMEVKWVNNPIAESYLWIIQRKRKEGETRK